jgi:GNAT superfamily N-acetyltransferase
MRLGLAEDDHTIRRCFAVMKELRPQYSEEQFVEQVRRQRAGGYALAFAEDEGEVRAVAGFRVGECLAWGRFLYVDDLVSRAADRSRGYGGRVFDWVVALARERGCQQFHLDSGVQRFGAHRFYLKKGMDITSHHFRIMLS